MGKKKVLFWANAVLFLGKYSGTLDRIQWYVLGEKMVFWAYTVLFWANTVQIWAITVVFWANTMVFLKIQ